MLEMDPPPEEVCDWVYAHNLSFGMKDLPERLEAGGAPQTVKSAYRQYLDDCEASLKKVDFL